MMVSDGKTVGCGVRRPDPAEWQDDVLESVLRIFDGAVVEPVGVERDAWFEDEADVDERAAWVGSYGE